MLVGASTAQFTQQSLGLLEVERIEAFGEPTADPCEEILGFASLAALGPEPGERGCGAELEGPGLLIARDRDSRSKASLASRNVCRIAPEQQLAPQAMQLGLVEAFRPFPHDAECLVENREPLIDAVRFVTCFGDQGEETWLPEPGACRSEIGQPLPHLHDALVRFPSALDQRPTVQDGPHRPPERIAVLAT